MSTLGPQDIISTRGQENIKYEFREKMRKLSLIFFSKIQLIKDVYKILGTSQF